MTRDSLQGSAVLRNGFGKNGFQQRAAGRVEEQPALLKVGKVHRRIADAELIELLAKGRVAFQSKADMVDRLGRAADAVALRADDVDERTALGIEPVSGNAADCDRPLPFLHPEDSQEEAPSRLQIAGANGDVVEVHVMLPFAFATTLRAFTSCG